jgi:hypothetical protein
MPSPVEARGAPLVLGQAVIANGQTASGAVDVNGMCIAGIDMGAAFTGTTLTIQNSVDGTNYYGAYDSSGNALSWTVAASRYLKFDPPLLGYKSIKLVSGSSEVAARTLTVVLVP